MVERKTDIQLGETQFEQNKNNQAVLMHPVKVKMQQNIQIFDRSMPEALYKRVYTTHTAHKTSHTAHKTVTPK